MNASKTLATFVIFGTLITATSGQTVGREESTLANDVLERRVVGDEAEYLTTKHAFSSSLWLTRAPGGMVEISGCYDDSLQQRWRPLGLSLREVLDEIVAADPRCRWEKRDGVINLVPVAREPALLNVRIKVFDVENASTAETALGQLLKLPAVQEGMNRLHLRAGLNIIIGPIPRPTQFSVHCKDATLRQVLNAIALAHGRAVWDYVETHCNGHDEVIVRFR